jgi:hypothetical protein
MKNCQVRILFILKYREVLDEQTGIEVSIKGLSSGLANSARFVHTMLLEEHITSEIVQVIDNNDIDREVSRYKPTHVVIEAFWVVPEKFTILQKLHPNVTWIVRSHSEVPFLAQEGVAIDWILNCVRHDRVCVASNSKNSVQDLRTIVAAANPHWSREKVEEKVPYLPNFYPHKLRKNRKKETEILDVACFGAIRPLKNQLIQAVAAIEYSEMIGKKLRFHINLGRTELGGENCLKNLRALFSHTPNAELIEEPWMNHEEFLTLLGKMDIGMQVTFTETFNIVSADMVVCSLPMVVSEEVEWAHRWCKASCTDTGDIVEKLIKITDWRFRNVVSFLNIKGLRSFSEESRRLWKEYFCQQY